MARKSDPELKEKEIIERTAPPGDVIYQAIYDEGEHELSRNSTSLALSGLAAGLSMGFSLLSEALLRTHLPNESWTILLSKLGYSVGFVVVILSRQQLFTKNTLTVILPLLREKRLSLLGNVVRLWALVLTANLIGALIFASLLAIPNLFERDVQNSFSAISLGSVQVDFITLCLRGIVAGWLVALMVWLLPFAESARIWAIIMIAYLIAMAGLPHVIAGSVEAFYLVVTSKLAWIQCLSGFLLPTLIGNVIGGIALVAVGAHAEFGEDLPGS